MAGAHLGCSDSLRIAEPFQVETATPVLCSLRGALFANFKTFR